MTSKLARLNAQKETLRLQVFVVDYSITHASEKMPRDHGAMLYTFYRMIEEWLNPRFDI